MKRALFVVTTALAGIVVTCAATAASATATVVRVISDADDGRTLSVPVGDRLTVSLGASNWTFDAPVGAAVQPEGPVSQRPSTTPAGCPIGSTGCGTTVRQYRAARVGTTTLSARRAACAIGARGVPVPCSGRSGRWSVTVRVVART